MDLYKAGVRVIKSEKQRKLYQKMLGRPVILGEIINSEDKPLYDKTTKQQSSANSIIRVKRNSKRNSNS